MTPQETTDERCMRWFYYGMNDKERIESLMESNDRLRADNANLRQEIERLTNAVDNAFEGGEEIMNTYEYLVGGLLNKDLTPEIEQAQLDKFGADGWGLIAVVVRGNYTMY